MLTDESRITKLKRQRSQTPAESLALEFSSNFLLRIPPCTDSVVVRHTKRQVYWRLIGLEVEVRD